MRHATVQCMRTQCAPPRHVSFFASGCDFTPPWWYLSYKFIMKLRPTATITRHRNTIKEEEEKKKSPIMAVAAVEVLFISIENIPISLILFIFGVLFSTLNMRRAFFVFIFLLLLLPFAAAIVFCTVWNIYYTFYLYTLNCELISYIYIPIY